MIPSFVFPSYLPTHTIPAAYSQATIPKQALLLADPDAELIFLFETTPSGGATLRLSDRGYTTEPSDTPANTPYRDLLLTPYNVELRIPAPDSGEVLGQLSFGLIDLEDNDGALDALLLESWEGREALVQVLGTYDAGTAGATTLTYAERINVLRGTIQSVGWEDGRIVLTLREVLQQLAEPVQENTYAGTGAAEGDEAIRETLIPLAYGEVFNASPVLVQAATQIFQWNDGPVEGVTAVRDQGAALTLDTSIGTGGDVADIFTAATPADGKYITQNSGGYIRLGAEPDGRITLDGQGDKTGGVYVDTVGEISKRIATRSGLSDPGDFDGGTFTGFPVIDPVGLYLGQEPVLAIEAIGRLLSGVFGWVATTRTGTLRIGQHRDPSVIAASVTITDDVLEDISDETIRPPVWRVEVEYARNWTVQDADALVDTLDGADRQLYSEPFRLAVAEDASVRTTHKDARILRLESHLATEAAALSLAAQVLSVLKVRRRTFRARAARQLFQRHPGDVVQIKSSGCGLQAGKNASILLVGEDAATGANDWELWG